MEEELKALELNNTWILTPLPKEKKAIASEQVYRIKYKLNGNVKLRLVTKGFNQLPGVDYTDNFSPVTKIGHCESVPSNSYCQELAYSLASYQ